jgi:hypothetical protein
MSFVVTEPSGCSVVIVCVSVGAGLVTVVLTVHTPPTTGAMQCSTFVTVPLALVVVVETAALLASVTTCCDAGSAPFAKVVLHVLPTPGVCTQCVLSVPLVVVVVTTPVFVLVSVVVVTPFTLVCEHVVTPAVDEHVLVVLSP